MRTTHTCAILEISPAAYAEIESKLREAGYDHAFVEDFIDMSQIGLKPSAALIPTPDLFWRAADPEESGSSVTEAMSCSPFFSIDEIASSYSGPTKFYFKAPSTDPVSDDEEEFGFDTMMEATEAARARKAELIRIGKIDPGC